MGGLGNQMFQYAFGVQLARSSGRRVSYDTLNGFKHDIFCRSLALGNMETKISQASESEIPIGMGWRSPWHRIAKIMWSMAPTSCQRVTYERNQFQDDSEVLFSKESPQYYYGYWQNEHYSRSIRETLLRDFTPRNSLSAAVVELIEEIRATRSVCIHVRRYCDLTRSGKLITSARRHHGVCSVEYYALAIKHIGVTQDTVYYVSSDDIGWVKRNLVFPSVVRYIGQTAKITDFEAFHVMTSCDHYIISNSSFSWWAAWMGRNPDKVVIAPKNWVRESPRADLPLCPKEWMRI
jgi:hypothetical protein